MTASSKPSSYVVVGGGLAGAKAVETLRREGFDGRLVLVGAERERPYERPPLSKEYLTGAVDRESIYVHDSGWYDEQRVELRLGRAAIRLATSNREVSLDGGECMRYDKLLIATGSQPRRLDVAGADLAGVQYLRTVADANSLHAALRGGGRQVVVVGGGWIGLETSAAARALGNEVTIVEPQPTPLYGVLGPELGEVFAQLHRDHGVELRLSTGVRELRGERNVHGVVTDGGDVLDADLVVVGVGVQPAARLASVGGLRVDNGIVVDAALRSSHPDVFAAGDVANAFHPLFGRRLRVEHWANAKASGATAARSMLGQPVRHDPIPYFYSDQYDLGLEYAGYAGRGDYDRVVYRGDVSARTFIAFWLAGPRVVAGMNVNFRDVNDTISSLVRQRVPVVDAELADPEVPLERLAHVVDGAA